MALATIKAMSAGWATVGQTFPPGVVRGPLKLGSLDTQTDVKCRWPDGSTKFAVLTAQVPTAGDYAVTEGAAPDGPPVLAVAPNVAVWVSTDAGSWGVRLRDLLPPPDLYPSCWLLGPNVFERRHVVPFTRDASPGGEEYPGLRAYLEVRYCRTGGVRLALTVENCLEGAEPRQYDLTIHQDGEYVVEPQRLTHQPYARYRLVFALNGLQEAVVLPDWSTAVAAGAVPQYPVRPTGTAARWSFPPLSTGYLRRYMPTGGERAELGPAPAWAAQALGGDAAALAETLAYGENASGAWQMHVRKPDGSLPTIDARPQWRFLPYVDPADPYFVPDLAHQPSLAYVPYLMTGDRFYADEMSFWANYSLASTFLETRGGSAGLLVGEETRGAAWGLLRVLEAAAYLPDADPLKAYFADKARNNLAWWGNHGRTQKGAWGVAWHGTFTEHGRQVVRPWTYDYLAHVLGRAAAMGFGGLADDWLKGWLNFRIGWLADPSYRQWTAAYTLPVDGNDAPGNYAGVWQDPPDWPKSHYWPDVLLSVTVAEELGDPRAAEARRWVEQNTQPQPSFAERPHFAVTARTRPMPPPDPEGPPVPEPDDLHPFAVPGLKIGMIGGRWDGKAFRLPAGTTFGVRAAGPLVDWYGGGIRWHGVEWPHPFVNGFAFPRAGVHNVEFVSGETTTQVPVVVDGPLDVRVSEPKVIASTAWSASVISDNTVGVDWDREQEGLWTFYRSGDSHSGGSIYRLSGTPDNPESHGYTLTTISGSPYELTFAGPVFHDEVSGLVLMACLGQYGEQDEGFEGNWGETFLAVSHDDGRTWRYAGLISTHHVPRSSWLADPEAYGVHSVGGTSLFCLPDAYLYSLPPVLTGPTQKGGDPSRLVPNALVRANLRAVVAAVQAGIDPSDLWEVYHAGRWHPHVAGNLITPVIPCGNYGGAQVQYCHAANAFVALVQCLECMDTLFLTWAPDLLGPWSPPQPVYRETRPGMYFGGGGWINPGYQFGRSCRVQLPTWSQPGSLIELVEVELTFG